MKIQSEIDPYQFDYMKLFRIKACNSQNELSIAESKGLKSSHISTFCRLTGLSLDHISIVLSISRKQMDHKMHKGVFSPHEADILLNIAKIVYEYFRLYPDIQDFWLLYLAGNEVFNGKSGLYLSKTEIGRGRVLAQIHQERDDYLRDVSKREGVSKKKRK